MCERATEENMVYILIVATKLSFPEPFPTSMYQILLVKILLPDTIQRKKKLTLGEILTFDKNIFLFGRDYTFMLKKTVRDPIIE